MVFLPGGRLLPPGAQAHTVEQLLVVEEQLPVVEELLPMAGVG